MTEKKKKLTDLTLDQRNANQGTEFGRTVLEKSLRQFGAGRSILIDKHGNVIAGNKTAEAAVELGIDEVIIVKTRGDQVVAVQRTDLDLEEQGGVARQMAYADNRAGEVGLVWDQAQLQFDLEAGLDLSWGWSNDQLEQIQGTAAGGGSGGDGGEAGHECPECGFKW